MPADRSDAACTVAGVRKPSMKMLWVAHRHVFDHAPAQRADGLLAHRGAPVLRWRLVDPSILKTGRPLVIVSRLLRHSIGATGSAPRAARSRKAGSFVGTFETAECP